MFGSKKTPARRNLTVAAGQFGIRVSGDHFKAFGQPDVPIAGATVTYETGEATRRVTASRVLLTGPFALALKKDSTKMFLTISGTDGSAIIMEVPKSKELKARQLAALMGQGPAE